MTVMTRSARRRWLRSIRFSLVHDPQSWHWIDGAWYHEGCGLRIDRGGPKERTRVNGRELGRLERFRMDAALVRGFRHRGGR